MNRKVLALLAFAVLAVSAGCLSGGGPSEENLQKNATYNWDTDANTTITMRAQSSQFVYDVQNKSHLDVFGRATFGQQEPLNAMSSLQFQYPDGTIVGADELNVTSTGSRTRIELPDRNGSVAFTIDRNGKELSTGVFLEGTHAVILPANGEIGVPLLSNVAPGGYTTSELTDGRTRIFWETVETDDIVVRYYLERDLLIFGGFFTLMLGLAIGGGLYYYREIKELTRQREEVGLDVDDGSDR